MLNCAVSSLTNGGVDVAVSQGDIGVIKKIIFGLYALDFFYETHGRSIVLIGWNFQKKEIALKFSESSRAERA